MDLYSVLVLVTPYLVGSIPTAVWVSKGLYGSDIRTYGSGNAGSTNMFRVFGFKAGILTQIVDILKGVLAAFIPVIILQFSQAPNILSDFSPMLQSVICGLIAVIGHVYPILAGFKGGKGINTMLGMMLVAYWPAGLICLGVFTIVLFITGYVSVSSMIGTLSFSVFLLIRGLITGNPAETLLLILAFSMFLIVVFTHRTNLQRLAKGNESRVNLWAKITGKNQEGKK